MKLLYGTKNLAVDKNAVENGFAKFFRDVLKI